MADTNIREFTLGVAREAEMGIERHRDLVLATALRGLRGVVMSTRVDTGRARGNWQVTEGAPAQGYEEERKDPAGGPTIGQGSSVIGGASGKDVIWLHNGVPYINILEDKDKMVAGNVAALQTWWDSQP